MIHEFSTKTDLNILHSISPKTLLDNTFLFLHLTEKHLIFLLYQETDFYNERIVLKNCPKTYLDKRIKVKSSVSSVKVYTRIKDSLKRWLARTKMRIFRIITFSWRFTWSKYGTLKWKKKTFSYIIFTSFLPKNYHRWVKLMT